MPESFPITDAVLQFTILVAAVLLVQLTVERLHLPGLIGLLLFGMFAGPDGFGLLPREPVVGLLGAIGLVYIMFLAGLEVDLEVARRHAREAMAFGVASFLAPLALAIGAAKLLGYGWSGALLLAAALSSHTLLSYPIVLRLRLLHERPVVAAIGGTLLTDTAALVLLAIVVQRATAGADGLGWLRPLGLLALLVGAALFLLPRIARHFVERVKASRAEKAVFALAVAMALATVAELIGTEDIVGAFLAGVCLNRALHRQEALLEHVRFAGQMIFIPFFFVETGMRLELAVLTGGSEAWKLAGLLLAVVVAGKVAAAWMTGALFGYSASGRAVMSGLSLPQAAATLAVTLTARRAGLLGEGVVDAVIIVIFLSCLAGPLLTRLAGRRLAGAAEPASHGSPFEPADDTPGARIDR